MNIINHSEYTSFKQRQESQLRKELNLVSRTKKDFENFHNSYNGRLKNLQDIVEEERRNLNKSEIRYKELELEFQMVCSKSERTLDSYSSDLNEVKKTNDEQSLDILTLKVKKFYHLKTK